MRRSTSRARKARRANVAARRSNCRRTVAVRAGMRGGSTIVGVSSEEPGPRAMRRRWCGCKVYARRRWVLPPPRTDFRLESRRPCACPSPAWCANCRVLPQAALCAPMASTISALRTRPGAASARCAGRGRRRQRSAPPAHATRRSSMQPSRAPATRRRSTRWRSLQRPMAAWHGPQYWARCWRAGRRNSIARAPIGSVPLAFGRRGKAWLQSGTGNCAAGGARPRCSA